MYLRSKEVELAAVARIGVHRIALTDDELRRVEELGAAEEARAQVQSAVADLPPDQREVVLLRFVHELSYAEIAERLGVSNVVVRARISRALRRLRTSPKLRAAVRMLER
jgi:RNA polymerase sigma factor (sigma-70 family)